MRVSPVINYSKNNKVNFGRFADDNAREVVRDALTIKDKTKKDEFTQSMYDYDFKRIDDCDFFVAYTDKVTGKVKGKFTDKFVKSNANNRPITRAINTLKEYGELEDLSNIRHIASVADEIRAFTDMLNGIDPSEKCRSSNPYGDARDEEQAREDFLNNLAD